MQASTERKALNVFERENSSNNQNLKWFDSIQQKLMSLGSPNIVQKDKNYINKPSQSDLLNQSNINSFNFRSLITGRGAEENNNFQIFGDQSIQLSTRGDEAIDVVCMNCGTYVQPQNVNIHSRECNQNQQLQSVSFFNKKRKQWLMIESNQKSLLKEMNEDISKIQEAIFSKLIKFDQKYENISLQIQTNSKKTYQVDNSFLSYKEFGNMIGDDNYFETSYNTSALVNQKQNFNVSEAQFQDQNLELIKKMSQISRLTIEKKESQIKNNQEDQKALILIKKLEYFIDQYSNLHAVCKQTLDINEDPMQLQIIMNVLVQDFKEMEETAVQQSLIKQQKDSINRSNQRQNISSVFQSPTHRLSNSEYKNIGSNSFIDQMIQNSNGYNQTSISYKTARKQDEIVYDQKHGQLLVFAKKLVQAIKEKLQALQNFENLLQEKYEMAQFQQNEEQESIYKEYTNRQTIQNEIQKMQIGQISLPNKQKVLLDAERNKISQLFDLETIHNNSEIKDSENSLQIDHLKSMSVRQSFQNSTPKNYVGQFMNSGYQYNQKSSKEDKYNNMRSSVVSKSVVNIQVQQPKEVVQKNIGEIEISVGPKLNIVQKSEKVDKIYQENLLNQIKSDQSSLINSKGNEKMKILTSEIDYPATSDFQKDIGYELFSVNVKQQNQEQNFDNKIQNQQNSQLSKASQQSPQKKNKKGGLSDFIENYVNDENEQMNIKFEKESDQNKISQKINAYEDHTFQNKQKSQIFLQNEIDKSPVDGRKSFKQFQLNKRQQNQINDSSYSERVAQLQQFQDQKIDLNFLKKQSQILKENQLQAQKQKIELNINRDSSDKQFENNNKNQKQLVNQQMSKSNFNDKQPIKLDQIFKDSNDSPNDSYKSSNEKQAQQIQFSFLNQNTKSLKKPTQFNKVNEIQQKSPQKSPLVQKQFLEKQERSNIFDRQKLKSPENFSTLQRQKSLQNSNLSQSKDQDKAVESQMIKKSYMPINTHEKLKAENEKLNKNKFESPDQKLNQNINQTTPQKFPKKSKKIDIETYGYDNDTIQNARKSVDRLMSATKNDQNAFQNRQVEQKFQQQNQMLQQFGLNIQGDRNQGQNEWNGIGQMNLATIQSVNETTEVSDIEQLNLMQESEAEHLIDNYKFNEKDIDTAKIESPPKSQRNNIFSKNRHRNCSKHSNSDNEQSESYRYTFEQRSDSVASQKKKSFLPQRTQSKEQNRKRTEQKQNIKQEEEKKQIFVSTEKPRKSRRINIEEFGYDGLTINRARNSVSSLSRQTILTNLSAQKDDKNNL